ncbi:MAG TPA: ABC transporter permease [Phototrophicaceae bacterium]|nr:ABC transporter permease [Phototrophicaceae bacterium]
MAKYTLRRLLQFIPTLFGVYTFAFFLMRVLPGDAATYLVGFHGSASALAALHAKLHLDDPILVQYVSFLGNLVRGDLGNSYITGDPVLDIIGRALPATAQLMVVATIISVALGLPLGVISALRKDSLVDNLTRILVVLGASLPTFWLGIQLQIVFAVNLHWLPVSGVGLDAHIILPSIALAVATTALLARMTRSSLLDELNQDYIRTAHSKGLRERAVVWRHALRNAFLPVLTVWGLSLADLLTGALLVEVIFSWPGMGRLLVQSITTRDYPLLQANLIILAMTYAGANLIVDLLYTLVDPRIRYD